MPNLEAQAAWVPVREIGIELARGGPNGNMNEQAKALLARTEWLDQQKASKSEIVQGHYEFNTYAEFNAIKSTLPLNCTVIINEMPTGTQTWGQGTNRWNGTTLSKSVYDPKAQAVIEAKNYADQTKLDVSRITVEYVDGNKIGSKTPKYLNLGVSSSFSISAATFYDSVVLRVKEGDLLFLLNDKQQYVSSNGGAFAFFADDPSVNRTQARITDNRASATDTATSLVHQKVTVPAGAKYLMLNTRYTNAAGTVNTTFTWAIHADVFSSSYISGVEVISEVLNTRIGKTDDLKKAKAYTDQQIANTEKTKNSVKNLFDPRTVISGSSYNNDGTIFYNAARRRTIKYPVAAGEWISISGMDGMPGSAQNTLQLWSNAGATFVSKVDLPTALTTTEFSTQIPNGVTHISFNINGTEVPPKLQLEKSQKPTSYEPYYLLENGLVATQLDSLITKKSSKNLWNGKVETRARFINSGVQATSNENDTITSFIPVEHGKYYTISGLDLSKIGSAYRQLHAYSSNVSRTSNWVKQIPVGAWSDTFTIYIDDANIKYILLPLTSSELGSTLENALASRLQVEEGQAATEYEPSSYSEDALKLYKASLEASLNNVKSVQPRFINEFVELNKVRNAVSSVTPVAKDLMPTGMGYVMEGQSGIENASNNLYAQTQSAEKGKKRVYAHLMKFLAGTPTLGTLKPTAFTIPSGQFDNDGTLANYNSRYSKAEYCHPNIAYDAVGVAGFKYWMISSILPTNNQGDVVWEDEDLFVSNDAKNWQRVRSLYESDKSYTTATLRLPPHSLATANARKYAFLPCPANGDTIEISVPADNGAIALDRVNITLTGLPWKHDPAILIDGGYVYTYHSFHLPYVDRVGGQNRFIVCVRTNDGINWEVVRTDGSTMLLTEENSRTIFTKDDQGRYNYMYYAYNRGGYMNPEIIKWGENDYELYYGSNFGFRVKGTTPYNFDFGTTYPIGPTASGNHPGLLKSGNTLYLINNNAVYKSTDRGATFTKLPYYPMWLGGVSGIPYKKALCVGEGGKVILVEAQRFHMQQFSMPAENQFSATNDANFMSLYEFESVSAFDGFAQNGLVDAYIDVQLCKVNLISQKREYFMMPALSLKNTTSIVNRPLQRLKVCDMNFEQGDTLHMYVTLNSRNGAKIVFGGIDIV
ncbi:hypothetical protein M1L59_07145 [Acinetobacter schindleri]|uniref:hypothetical protein n=1 Tax=Acinetobacter schindleri TaxID=108981 RepID=UPI00200A6E06|nr:hypothetical protein [Acinetobacter schindleri]MCK8640486.1 hypothetical protein [Acinetobacter schindleri]